MFFTITHYEKHTGAEFCCDTCNKRYIETLRDGVIDGPWWYVRYNLTDEYPSLWICNNCKEGME